MKWNELKEKVQEVLDKETSEENRDPEINYIDISAGSLMFDPEVIIFIEDGELEIF